MVLARGLLMSCAGWFCLCALTAGCVSTTETKSADGSTLFSNRIGALAASKKKKPSANLHLSYARLQEERGDPGRAREEYEKVLAENRKSVDAQLGLARIDYLAGRTVEAEAHFKEALRLQPKSAVVQAAAGQFYAEEGRLAEATLHLNEAVRLAPDDKTTRYHLAVALAKSGEIEQSLPHFTQSVGAAAAQYNIGVILHEKGDLLGSERHLMLALGQDPNLEDAKTWLSDVRREKEAQLADANSPGSAGRNLINGGAATRRELPPNVQSVTTAYNQQFMPNGQGGGMPQITAAGGSSVVVTPAPQIAAPAGAQSTTPAGLTPQQWEQWKNQRSTVTASTPGNMAAGQSSPR